MTLSRCWVTFENDRALQGRVKRGDFTDTGAPNLPIGNFPAAPGGNYWISILRGWCKQNQIPFRDEGLEVTAKVKKKQIEDFMEFVYARDPFYFDPDKMLTWKGRAYLANSLNDLRSFVAQQLNPRLWYELKADEF